MRIIQKFSIITLAVILCIALVPGASAHRVHVQEQISEIQVKAWFGGGDPMIDANVDVYAIKDGQEELYLQGTTDEDGAYFFAPKIGITEYRIVAEKSGHKGETMVDLAGGVQQDA